LPLYTSGLVLRALSTVSIQARDSFGVAGPAALGASVGVLFTGTVGIVRIGAPSLILFALMALSASALVQGLMIGERPQVELSGVDEPADAASGSEAGHSWRDEEE
jgi:hypothetical protein